MAATTILAPGAVASCGSLPGNVTDVAYRGRGYDHVVTGPAGTLSAVFDPCSRPRGSAVEVAVEPGGCVAYPTGEPAVSERYGKEVTIVSMMS